MELLMTLLRLASLWHPSGLCGYLMANPVSSSVQYGTNTLWSSVQIAHPLMYKWSQRWFHSDLGEIGGENIDACCKGEKLSCLVALCSSHTWLSHQNIQTSSGHPSTKPCRLSLINFHLLQCLFPLSSIPLVADSLVCTYIWLVCAAALIKDNLIICSPLVIWHFCGQRRFAKWMCFTNWLPLYNEALWQQCALENMDPLSQEPPCSKGWACKMKVSAPGHPLFNWEKGILKV